MTSGQWRHLFSRLLGSIHPKKIEEGKIVEQVKHDELSWKDRVRITETHIYAENPTDLVSAIASEENKIAKENYFRGLRWIMEKFK